MFSTHLKRLALILVFPVAGLVTLTVHSGKIAAQTPEVVEPSPSLEKAPIRDKAAVRFKFPTKLNEALSEVRSQGISVDYIQREYKVGNQTHVGFLFVDDKLDATAITNEYWKFYESAIENRLKDPGPPAANLDSETGQGQPISNQTLEEDPKGKEARILHHKLFEEQRQKFKPYQGCWKTNTCPEIFVTEMQVSGDTTKLSKLKVNPKFERVKIRSEVKRVTPLKQVSQNSHNKQISSLLPRPQQLSIASKIGVNELTSAPRLYAQSYGYERNTIDCSNSNR